jgi:signal transduction histidine kinase
MGKTTGGEDWTGNQLRAACDVSEPVAMREKKRGKLEPGREGLNLANVLRESLLSALIVLDPQERITLLAGETEELLGLKQQRASGYSNKDLPDPVQKLARDAMASGRATLDREIKLKVPRKGIHSLQVSAMPVRPGAKGSGVALVIRDLTSPKSLENDLRRLDRLASMGTLAAGMAHEIKNALVAGKTFVQSLLEKNEDGELVSIVRRELDRIDSIVSQMLKFASAPRPEFAAIHLHEVLDFSLRLVDPHFKSKSIALNRSFGAAGDLVEGDDYQLQQAFVNLFLNSLDAMPPYGTLSVGTGQSNGRSLCVTISDTGAGIPPEIIDRMFEPFFTTKPNGTGLGLPITRRIIYEHGGSMSVESQPHKGATFTILLPIVSQAG